MTVKDIEVTIQDLFEEYEGEPRAEKVTLFEPVGRKMVRNWSSWKISFSCSILTMTTNLKRFVVQ